MLNNTTITMSNRTKILRTPFEVVTIAGYHYIVTLKDVAAWFSSKWWWVFFASSVVLLILFMPHNRLYELTWPERLYFWPVIAALYVLLYNFCMYLGARFAMRAPGRYYYSPLGMIVSTAICTYFSTYWVGFMHQTPPDLGLVKALETVFNMLWASIFEAVYFAFYVPRIKNKPKRSEDWEHFD